MTDAAIRRKTEKTGQSEILDYFILENLSELWDICRNAQLLKIN